MATKTKTKPMTLLEQYLLLCLAVAVKIMAQQTGRSFAVCTQMIMGQGAIAFKESMRSKRHVTDPILAGIRQIMGKQDFLSQKEDDR